MFFFSIADNRHARKCYPARQKHTVRCADCAFRQGRTIKTGICFRASRGKRAGGGEERRHAGKRSMVTPAEHTGQHLNKRTRGGAEKTRAVRSGDAARQAARVHCSDAGHWSAGLRREFASGQAAASGQEDGARKKTGVPARGAPVLFCCGNERLTGDTQHPRAAVLPQNPLGPQRHAADPPPGR